MTTTPTASADTPMATPARGTMPLAQHVQEARRRLVRSAAAIVVGVALGYLVSDAVLDLLRQPIAELAATRNASLNYDSVSGAFDLKVSIALLSGVVLASPIWLHQLFAFVAPGLRPRERRYTFGFVAAAVPLFLAGCAAGLLVFPHVVEVLASFAPSEDSSVLQASAYVEFVLKLVAATGVAFVLPVFVVLLNLLGMLPARRIQAGWRWIVLAILLFSALATPSADVVSMLLLAAPMAALFAAAAVAAALHDRAIARRAAAAAASAPSDLP
ncbi:twin-arginine translocase subunit TatC [Herbiconiux liukaitaii]|uniref:twin-arginine translocase subunit TatC n=1 Tax=Herbiconiux liukaitaii TaxID=3342799 RepID=UPI0035BA56F7